MMKWLEGLLVLQLRHGQEKTEDSIKEQIKTMKASRHKKNSVSTPNIKFPLLLCYDKRQGVDKQTVDGVDVFSVDGSKICFAASFIYLRTPGELVRASAPSDGSS